MAEKRQFRAIKGTRDILPPDSALWNRVEQTAREVFASYGFGEIRTPIIELARLFERSIGSHTDVVTKELFTWIDSPKAMAALRSVRGNIRKTGTMPSQASEARQRMLGFVDDGTFDGLAEQNRLVLRPEATASVVRAYIENGMHTWPQPVRLYYSGPMFRRERPQKGRYRQFYQIGAEVLGRADEISIDTEMLEMLVGYFRRVGLTGTTLFINSIGDANCRPKYIELLRQELKKVASSLGGDSKRRIETNPLRILDSKLPDEQPIIERLPRISDHLCTDCHEHFAKLKDELKMRGIVYEENWRLVRGLDYYIRTTFEITASSGVGSQNAVCGGGRYDGLAQLLGGPPTPGFGFAIGTDRLILALTERTQSMVSTEEEEPLPSISVALQSPDLFVAGMDDQSWREAARLAGRLRARGLFVYLPKSGTRLARVFDSAHRVGTRVVIIVGEDEMRSNTYTIRIVRAGLDDPQPRDVPVRADQILLYGKVVRLRQDLERALARLAANKTEPNVNTSVLAATQRLIAEGVLPAKIAAGIKDLIPILNEAIHGRSLTDGSVEWALAYGNLLLNELEELSPVEGTGA